MDGVTVGVAASAAGVSVRTLHYWDAVGIARPSGRSRAGYRLYSEADVARLRRIAAYHRAGLDLEAIAAILDTAPGELGDAIGQQRRALAERIDELRRLDDDLARVEEAQERGVLLGVDEQAAAFGDGWDAGAPAAARARWGATAQWAQFAEASARRTGAEWEAAAASLHAFERELAAAVADGVGTDSDAADALVERHRVTFSQLFPLTVEMQVCLGRMFDADAGFAAHYDGLHPGAAAWFRAAVDASARRAGIDPDQASWG